MADIPKRGPGKNKAFLMNRLQDMYGKDFHPIMQMAKNAAALQEIADEAKGEDLTSAAFAANQAWEKIAPYLEPKLTATSMDLRATEVPHEDWLEDLDDDE